jgi:hypothetical protein
MDEGSTKAETGSAPRPAASDVGWAGDPDSPAPEDAELNPQRELEHLDESLSEMTNLLLAGDSPDELGIEGEFEAPRAQSEFDRQPEPSRDAVAGVEDAQDAVAAAMEQVAEALGPGAEPEAVNTPPDEADPEEVGSGQGDSELTSAAAAMEAVAADLDPAGGEEVASDSSGALPSAEDAREGDPASELVNFPSRGDLAPSGADAAPREAEGLSAGSSREEHAAPPAGAAERAPASPASGPTARATAATKAQPKTSKALVIRRTCAALGSAVAVATAAGLGPIGQWLDGSSRVLRHSIAWLALWTAFNAVSVWTYILVFRSAMPGGAATTATQIEGAATEEQTEAP